jgi:2-amino-4-hydroxy-6-hydroxymethyldihydropteridine diphosphokinase
VSRLAAETEIRAVSRMYASEPFGRAFQPWFLNLAVRVATRLPPRELLRLAKRLERDAGRRAGARWGPRPLDADIILMGDTVISEAGLTVPHVATACRLFCLVPVAEVAPEMVVPPGGRTVTQMLATCEDKLEVIAI